MTIDRRRLIGGAAALAGTALAMPAVARVKPFAPHFGPRSRVVYVNDLAGDIDGLFATVHMLLSPTSELQAIIGSSGFGQRDGADAAAANARTIVGLMRKTTPVFAGSNVRFDKTRGQSSPGVDTIIREAMRTDSTLPLYVAVGGGLTEVANAIAIEPKVAERITLIWIGGGSMPAGVRNEPNFNIDPLAAQFVFNETSVKLWTIPQAVYATCVVTATELQARVAPRGRIGAWLYRKLVEEPVHINQNLPAVAGTKFIFNTGETWTLGDSPLAVLTSLGDWVPNFDFATRVVSWDKISGGQYDEVVCPMLNPDGTFTPRSEGRKVRIFKSIDTRLMFGDFFDKLAVNYP